jgi:hypothetical protein
MESFSPKKYPACGNLWKKESFSLSCLGSFIDNRQVLLQHIWGDIGIFYSKNSIGVVEICEK